MNARPKLTRVMKIHIALKSLSFAGASLLTVSMVTEEGLESDELYLRIL